MDLGLLWIPATLIAAAAQTARNAMQRHLTEVIGTAGATQVRFLYGLPFSIVFLVALVAVTGETPPVPTREAIAFIAGGAVAQILATGLMLAAMRVRGFAVVTAYIKTEPVLVALFGVVVLGEVPTVLGAIGIVIATVGVIVASRAPLATGTDGSWRVVGLGLVAGACFAVAAVGFRGGILALPEGSFYMRATTTLVIGLAIQSGILAVWLAVFDRPAVVAIVRAWRPSLFAGFMGAFASQFWFIGFSLTSAANVRTLALIEVLLAAAVSRTMMGQTIDRRQTAGMALIVAGVALLLLAHA